MSNLSSLSPQRDTCSGVVEEKSKAAEAPPPKRLGSYNDPEKKPRIFVAPVAADVATGRLIAIPQEEPIVNALLAATAFVPLFPAVKLSTKDSHETKPKICVDGVNIANEPTSALVDLLRLQLHPKAKALRIFQVSSLPLSRTELRGERKEYIGLVQVVARVLQLRRFRDAGQERKLTQLYSALLPPDRPLVKFESLAPPKEFVQGTIHPIDLENPIKLNERILATSNPGERRLMILETVADGCRATLQAILRPSIEEAIGRTRTTESGTSIPQNSAVACATRSRARIGRGGSIPGVGRWSTPRRAWMPALTSSQTLCLKSRISHPHRHIPRSAFCSAAVSFEVSSRSGC
jgi:hypothetical protein